MERKCPIECGTVVCVLQKTVHPVEIYVHQIEALSFFFSILLVRTIILKIFYLFFGVLAAFYKFHWISKAYATLTMGNRFLGVQISIIWVVFAVKSHTAVATTKISGHCKRVSLQYSHLLRKLITKGPQLSWKQTFYSCMITCVVEAVYQHKNCICLCVWQRVCSCIIELKRV